MAVSVGGRLWRIGDDTMKKSRNEALKGNTVGHNFEPQRRRGRRVKTGLKM
jgi:hypothetical protein